MQRRAEGGLERGGEGVEGNSVLSWAGLDWTDLDWVGKCRAEVMNS